jgi:hypothetical protein
MRFGVMGAKSDQGAATLQRIVRSYLSDCAEDAERELRFYRIQRTLQEAIALAALSKLPSGKRHKHQRRIPARTLELAKERLLGVELGGCKTFDELHTAVRSSIGAIRGIADLTIYDTSLRIGANALGSPRPSGVRYSRPKQHLLNLA